MARILDAIAPLLGVPVEDPYLFDELGLPTMQELMKTADQRKESDRQRRQGFRLGPLKPARKVASGDESETNRKLV